MESSPLLKCGSLSIESSLIVATAHGCVATFVILLTWPTLRIFHFDLAVLVVFMGRITVVVGGYRLVQGVLGTIKPHMTKPTTMKTFEAFSLHMTILPTFKALHIVDTCCHAMPISAEYRDAHIPSNET